MRNRWLLALTTSSLIGIAALAGCGGTSTTAPPAHSSKAGGSITVGVSSDFVTLSPAMSSALIDRQAFINIFDPLVKLSPKMALEPNLVVHWTVSNAGKTYTLYLRKGVRFQDGTPFNAAAVLYNWKWEMNPTNASPRRSNLALVKSLAAPNPYTIVVKLKAPFAPFLYVLAGRTGMISSPTAMKKWGSAYGLHPVGTGPFEFVKWVQNSYLKLKKNPHYWQAGRPYLNQVTYTPIVDPTQEFNALTTNQVQLVDGVPGQDVASLPTYSSTIHYSISPGLGYADMELNTTVAPLNNVHNREAIDYAINRQAIIKLIYFGTATPAYSQFSPASWAYDPNIKIPFSDALAKAQLVKAGNPSGFSFTLLGNNDPVTLQEMQLIQSELAKVGIKVHLSPVDFTTLLTDAIKGNYQADLLGWSGRPSPDQNSYAFDTTGGSFNDPRYSNPEVNSLLLQAREASSQATAASLYHQVARIVLHDAPYIFLAYPDNIKAWSVSVHGYVNYADGLMRLKNVWVGK